MKWRLTSSSLCSSLDDEGTNLRQQKLDRQVGYDKAASQKGKRGSLHHSAFKDGK